MVAMLEPATPCPTCGGYKGHGLLPDGRGPCPEMSRAEIEERLMQYYGAWLELQTTWTADFKKRRQQVEFWQGKFAAVKQENNRLRKALRAGQK